MSRNSPAIPPLFLERMAHWLGEEYPSFFAALAARPVSALRVNTLKLSATDFQQIAPFPLGETVAWCPSAFLLPAEAEGKAGKHPYHLAGLYYLQDPSAMAVAEILAPQPGERVLDLAAAPGGKTTHLAARMAGEGLLVANEIKTSRLGHLCQNVERWGAANVVVTNETPERLADTFGAFFDRVLVDAPCSGEGMFRKDERARADWSLSMVAGCAARQRHILRLAARLVRPGGYLLYSTCTFAPEENEAVIYDLLQSQPGEFEIMEIPRQHGFLPGQPAWAALPAADRLAASLSGAVRLLPHRLTGEGHFICLLQRRKNASASSHGSRRSGPATSASIPTTARLLWREFAERTLQISLPEERLFLRGERLYLAPAQMPAFEHLRLIHAGIWLGTCKKDRFEPAHPLALFLQPGQAQQTLNLSPTDPALAAYLRGASLPSAGKPGWVLITVDGWPCGWGKRVQEAIKNHYPRGWMPRGQV